MKKKRSLNTSSIPKPTFEYDKFQSWLQENKESELFIEIGCGVGLHPIQWALQNSNKKLIALERTIEKYNKFQRRLSNHSEIKNIWPAHADATQLLPHLNFKPCSITGIFILYPNPDPKQHQRSRRWSHSLFMEHLVHILKPKGFIEFATNLPDYAYDLKNLLPQRLPLKLCQYSMIKSDAKPRTHFEKKYLLRGDSCFSLIFTKPN